LATAARATNKQTLLWPNKNANKFVFYVKTISPKPWPVTETNCEPSCGPIMKEFIEIDSGGIPQSSLLH